MLEHAETSTEGEKGYLLETVPFAEIAGKLKSFPAYAESDLNSWQGVGTVEQIRLNTGAMLTWSPTTKQLTIR